MAKEVILTPQGFEKLKTELDELTTVRRREVAERIKQAREFGDISENSEYDDAKNEQAMLEAQIAELDERLRAARVIDTADLSKDVVEIGSTIELEGPMGREVYQVVGSAESDPDDGRLSNESPIGRAVLGSRAGDSLDVTTPNGNVKVKVVSIKR